MVDYYLTARREMTATVGNLKYVDGGVNVLIGLGLADVWKGRMELRLSRLLEYALA